MRNPLKQAWRRLAGTESVVKNLTDQLRSERQLIQTQASELQAETHAVLRGLQQSLDATNLSLAAIPRPPVPAPSNADTPAAVEAAAHLDRTSVFCVGSARSGTTILMHCLNRSPQLHIVGECNSYRHRPGQHFRKRFNERMAEIPNPRYKGTWLPDLAVDPSEPRRYFAALSTHYDRVGEKLAFGPEEGISTHLDNFLDYQGTGHLRSHYFCTIREPVACVLSMCKMFPFIDRRHVCRTWLLTAATIIDLYRAFPNVFVIINERFTPATIEHIASILNVDIPLAPGTINGEFITTRPDGSIPDLLTPVAAELDRLTTIYARIRDAFDASTLKEDSTRFMLPILDELRRDITVTLAEFDTADEHTVVGPMHAPSTYHATDTRP